ncbi:MAG TPA: cytochrome P450 [Actinospica sp.]|nr:cytochrome P450 [Actinospica sp.]
MSQTGDTVAGAAVEKIAVEEIAAGGSTVEKIEVDTEKIEVDTESSFGALLTADPASAYQRLREAGVCPVSRDDGTPAWVVARHAEVARLLADPALSMDKRSSRHGFTGFGFPPVLDRNLLNMDDPDHARIRRLAAGAFTPRRIEAQRERIKQHVDTLLDGLGARDGADAAEPVDLIAGFAEPLPVYVICELIGIPAEDGARFRRWTTVLQSTRREDRDAARAAVGQMIAYLTGLIAARRAEPRDDLLSALIAARDGGERLTENELVSLLFLILWAGYENSVHLVANSVVSLLAQPEQLDVIRRQPDPYGDAMGRAVEELLRHDQPVIMAIRRFPVEDVEVAGARIPAGDMVQLCLASANSDPAVFTEPERLDLARDPNPHFGLGQGPHYCLGAALARLEARIAVWTLFHRYPRLRLAVPAGRLRYKRDYRQHGLLELPVLLTSDGD